MKKVRSTNQMLADTRAQALKGPTATLDPSIPMSDSQRSGLRFHSYRQLKMPDSLTQRRTPKRTTGR